MLLCLPTAFALDPQTSLLQAQHTAWTLQDGAPSRIVDLAQTGDGFLWLASQMGLYRFDGMHFVLSPLPGTEGTQPDITSLTPVEGNELWVGTRRNGVYHLRAGSVLQHLTQESGLPRATVYSLRKDGFGNLWLAGSAGVFLLHGDRFTRVWPAPSEASKPAANLWRNVGGTLCFTTDGAVWCKAPAQQQFQMAFTGAVEDLAVDAAGEFRVWISGQGVAPLQAATGKQHLVTAAMIHTPIPHGHCVFTRSGDLYFLTYGHGLTRIASKNGSAQTGAPNAAETFSSAEGLQSPYLSSVMEDREGNVWVGTTKGLERFRNGRFVSMPRFAGEPGAVLLPGANGTVWVGRRNDPLLLAEPNNQVLNNLPNAPMGITSAFRDSDGSAWFGASPLLWHMQGRQATAVSLPPFVQGASDIQAIARDAEGRLRISVVRYGLLTFQDGTWWRADSGSAGTTDYPTAFLLDSQSRFFTAFHGHLEVQSSAGTQSLRSPDTLGDVLSLAEGDGLLLAGAEHGLGIFLNGRLQPVLTDAQGELRNISGMVFSTDGALWLHGSSALLRIAPDGLSFLRAGNMQKLHAQLFSFADGLPGLAPAVRPFPSVALATGGRLWVSTTSGVAWLDTLHYPRDEIAPSVEIDPVRANDRTYVASGNVELPPRSHGIRFDWTAPSLSVRDGVHFRTRLVGFDADWQDVGSTHSVTYASLPAGSYRFEVEAANEDDVWNRAGDTVGVTVALAFYQRGWFQVLGAAAATLLLWLLYRMRLRTVTTRVRNLMAERLAERERIAAELHDTLLQSVQGLILLFSGVAAQLPVDSRASASAEAALQRAELLLEEGRDSVRDLRQKNTDLPQCFQALREEFTRKRTEYTFTLTGRQPDLQVSVGEEVYKLGREAVRNAAQHAEASMVSVHLAFEPHALLLTIQDNGVGMDEDMVKRGRAGHWGLKGMGERSQKLGGTLLVQSRPGEGTTVRLNVPASMAYRNSTPTLAALLRSYWSKLREAVKGVRDD